MRVTFFAMLCIAVVLAGCTSPVAQIAPLTISATTDGDFEVGQQRFLYQYSGGTGPYTVSFDLDEAHVLSPESYHPRYGDGPSTEPEELMVAFDNQTDADLPGVLRIIVTDAAGQTAVWETSYVIAASERAPANAAPTLTASAAGDGTVDVTVDDPEGDDVTVKLDTLSDGSGIDVTPGPAKVVKGGHGTVQLTAEANHPFAGESGQIDVLAGDIHGGISQQRLSMQARFHWPKADALYAIPMQTTVHVGEPVLIVIATSPTAHPAHYFNTRVCAPAGSGFDYAELNDSSIYPGIGAPGGGNHNDGVWAQLGVGDNNFFGLVEDWIHPLDTGDGRIGMDVVSLFPLDGHDLLGVEGAICNFYATFSAAGSWHLTFQQNQAVNRTYYHDDNQAPDYFWSDISNDAPGIPNTVTVLP